MKKIWSKKFACAIMSVIMLLGVLPTANATDIMPIYERVSSATCSFTISSAGKAEAFVSVTAERTDTVRGTIEIKRFVSGEWVTVASWTETSTRSLRDTYTRYVLSGYSYKLFATVDIYTSDGVYCETVYLESNQVLYY